MNDIERNIHVLECASLHIQETASPQDYSLEALDRLKNAVEDAKIAFLKMEQLEEAKKTIKLKIEDLKKTSYYPHNLTGQMAMDFEWVLELLN